MKKISHKGLKSIIYLNGLAVLFPLGVLIIWSFTGLWPWPNILPQSYSARAMDEVFGGTLGAISVFFSSIIISVIVSILAIAMSISASRALVFYNFYGKNFIKFAVLLPVIVPTTAFAMGIQIIFIKLGLNDTALGVVIVHIILCLPYTVRIMVEVTEAMGDKLEVQARVLGASPLKVFVGITLPTAMPGIISSASMAFIISFSQYFLTLLIGGGNIVTYSMLMFPYIQSGDRSLASMYSLVFIGSTLLIFLVFEKAVKKHYKMNGAYFFN